VHEAVEKLDLREFESRYSEGGHPAYHPALLLKIRLYACALEVTSSRRLGQRFRLRWLAKVTVEFTRAAIALNLTRTWHAAPALRIALRSETASRSLNFVEGRQEHGLRWIKFAPAKSCHAISEACLPISSNPYPTQKDFAWERVRVIVS
jgi:hypothetical protein